MGRFFSKVQGLMAVVGGLNFFRAFP